MVYGLIMCAGKQSRYSSSTPKALAEINGIPILDINIANMSEYADKVYVVCSYDNKNYFNKYRDIITIDSGKGSGDAVMKALQSLPLEEDDSCFVQWGDSIQLDTDIFSRLVAKYDGTTLIPCVCEEKPYVQIVQTGSHIRAIFSKYGEETSSGYHDLSLFYCNAKDILYYLEEWYYNNYSDGHYSHKHNNEFEFLDVFNDTDIKASVLNIKYFNDLSFNTVEQFEKVKEKLYV